MKKLSKSTTINGGNAVKISKAIHDELKATAQEEGMVMGRLAERLIQSGLYTMKQRRTP